ncbi:hypothetical protein GCM10010378_07240 [Streptomyces viridochromogenes]
MLVPVWLVVMVVSALAVAGNATAAMTMANAQSLLKRESRRFRGRGGGLPTV